MSIMTLCAQHFVQGNPITILNTCRKQWTHVLCFHATRLPDKEMLLRKGIQVPTEDSIAELLRCCGITPVSPERLRHVLDENGRSVFVHLNENFLRSYCKYHRCGAEKIRKYVNEVCPQHAHSVERHLDLWTPFIIQLNVPVEYFAEDDLWKDCERCPSDLLVNDIDSLDITMECRQTIPAQYIQQMYEVRA